jgi:phosphatidylserine/phosphatidylglycerophosphate/cardiolipin synthase-like enzyme
MGVMVCGLAASTLLASAANPPKQRALDEWRAITAPDAPPPRVFVKGDNIRFYFPSETNFVEFSAHWSRVRVPSEGYRVNSGLLRWEQRLAAMPSRKPDWSEATVIAGAEWRRLTTNIVAVLTPNTPGHGVYYQGFLADRLWYRDAAGAPRSGTAGALTNIVVDQRFSIDETMQAMAAAVEEDLKRKHPGDSLFLFMAPNARQFPQPLLLDFKHHECVWISPGALYDPLERGLTLATTADGLSALFLESHGYAILKGPVSSAARLVDLVAQTLIKFVRLPLSKSTRPAPDPTHPKGMDLAKWESWLDLATSTRRHDGSLDLLIDGERFFPRLQQAIANATNHIHFDVYIFDKDDVAVDFADQLKRRSRDVDVKVILDRMGSIGGGLSPPATPLPENFVAPKSIISYLRKDSDVHVHPFLNPWLSTDHAKVLLVDGTTAWVGGMNIGREYRYEWHDVMVEMHGPVVTSLEHEFRRDWAHEGPLGDLAYAVASMTPPMKSPRKAKTDHWIKVRLLPTETGHKPFNTAVLGSINRARDYLYVENPYLFDKKTVAALVKARMRGVDVRVILPHVNDLKAGGRSNLIIANYLLQHGVRVFFYPGMSHVKALLVDGWSCLGSANLNHLSMRLCQEQNVATSDPDFAARLKKDLFDEDFSRSDELTEPISVDWMDFLADQVLVDI